MCATLMNAKNADTEELAKAIARKMNKFGSVENMPKETAQLVRRGQAELARRRSSS